MSGHSRSFPCYFKVIWEYFLCFGSNVCIVCGGEIVVIVIISISN